MIGRKRFIKYLIIILIFFIFTFIMLSGVLLSSISIVVGENSLLQEPYINSFAKQNFNYESVFLTLFNYGYLKLLPLIIVRSPVVWIGSLVLTILFVVLMMIELKAEFTLNHSITSSLVAMNDDIDKLLINQLDQTSFEKIHKLDTKHKHDLKVKENEKNELIEYQENMMHEIKNELAIINLQIQSKSSYQDVIVELEKIDYLVNMYLKVAKLSNSKMLMQLKPISIGEIIETIIYDYQLQISEKNIRIDNLIDSAEIIWADSFWTSHAISNVASNSINCLHNNGIIKFWVEENEYYKDLIIEDDGPGGLASEKVLERYFTNSTKGYGIGLSLASKVMELHHGSLNIVSSEEKGTKVIFHFPKLKVKEKIL